MGKKSNLAYKGLMNYWLAENELSLQKVKYSYQAFAYLGMYMVFNNEKTQELVGDKKFSIAGQPYKLYNLQEYLETPDEFNSDDVYLSYAIYKKMTGSTPITENSITADNARHVLKMMNIMLDWFFENLTEDTRKEISWLFNIDYDICSDLSVKAFRETVMKKVHDEAHSEYGESDKEKIINILSELHEEKAMKNIYGIAVHTPKAAFSDSEVLKETIKEVIKAYNYDK